MRMFSSSSSMSTSSQSPTLLSPIALTPISPLSNTLCPHFFLISLTISSNKKYHILRQHPLHFYTKHDNLLNIFSNYLDYPRVFEYFHDFNSIVENNSFISESTLYAILLFLSFGIVNLLRKIHMV